jgi:acetyl-CoA synthetase
MTWHAVAAYQHNPLPRLRFPSESRVQDCRCRVVITSDEVAVAVNPSPPRPLSMPLSRNVVEHVLVLKRIANLGRHKRWHEEARDVPRYCPPETTSSEDPLFILYASPSSFRMNSTHHHFHLHADFRFHRQAKGCRTRHWRVPPRRSSNRKIRIQRTRRRPLACMANIGCITGHTHIIYGPLSNLKAVTTTVSVSTPVYPTSSRYWRTTDKYKLTQFYSTPTAIRLLRRLGSHHVENSLLFEFEGVGKRWGAD